MIKLINKAWQKAYLIICNSNKYDCNYKEELLNIIIRTPSLKKTKEIGQVIRLAKGIVHTKIKRRKEILSRYGYNIGSVI